MEHQNSDDQGNRSSAASPVSLGALLREARERLNFSVADVAVQIKFAPRQIEALEADDFKSLPETAFLRGFVRSYAKILNLDAQPLLAALPKENTAPAELVPPSVEVPYPVDNASQRQTLILLGAALLLAVAAVGFSVWHYTVPPRQSAGTRIETPVPLTAEKQAVPTPPVQEHSAPAQENHSEAKRESSTAEQTSIQPEKSRPEKPLPEKSKAITSITQPSAAEARSSVRAAKTKAAAAAAQSSVSAAKTKATAAAAKSSVPAAKTKAVQAESVDSGNMNDMEASDTTLRLVFDEESWAEITDKDGNLISSQINPRGSELNVKGRLPLTLVVGHAATTHLFKDGKPVDLTPYINSSSEVARVTLK